MAAQSEQVFGAHELLARDDHVKPSSDRAFGFVFAAVFAVVAAYGWFRGSNLWIWWFCGALAFSAGSLAAPHLLSPLNRAWTHLGLVLFKIINPIVLGIVFYLCVVPIGLALGLAGKDLLRLRWNKDAPSYWISRAPPGPSGDSFHNQF